MAKKAKKVIKAAKKPAKKTAKKAARSAAPKSAGGPRPIGTGKGASVSEVAHQFVEMYRSGTADTKIWDAVFAKNWTSIEGCGVNMAFEGRRAVEAKCKQWMDAHEIHGSNCDGPYLGATGFAVVFTIDTTEKASGQRISMREIAVFSVLNGKIVQEEFMYGGG